MIGSILEPGPLPGGKPGQVPEPVQAPIDWRWWVVAAVLLFWMRRGKR